MTTRHGEGEDINKVVRDLVGSSVVQKVVMTTIGRSGGEDDKRVVVKVGVAQIVVLTKIEGGSEKDNNKRDSKISATMRHGAEEE